MSVGDDLEAAFKEIVELGGPQVDWVHPSWRDVVIEHLMTHPADRRRFLSHCGVNGLALALSVSGGQAGERQLPLLQRPDDWTAARLRAVQLAPLINDSERRQLLAALRGLSEIVPAGALRTEATRMQREVLETLVVAWNEQATAITQSSLELFYIVSLEVRPLVAGPRLDATWEVLADQLALDDEFDVAETRRALEFLRVVMRNEPRFLSQIGWPSRFGDSVAAIVQALSDFASSAEHILEALEADDGDGSTDLEELASEAYLLSRIAVSLAALDVTDADQLANRIKEAENECESWLEHRAEEAAIEEEIVFDAEEDAEPDPEAFDLDELFRDL